MKKESEETGARRTLAPVDRPCQVKPEANWGIRTRGGHFASRRGASRKPKQVVGAKSDAQRPRAERDGWIEPPVGPGSGGWPRTDPIEAPSSAVPENVREGHYSQPARPVKNAETNRTPFHICVCSWKKWCEPQVRKVIAGCRTRMRYGRRPPSSGEVEFFPASCGNRFTFESGRHEGPVR